MELLYVTDGSGVSRPAKEVQCAHCGVRFLKPVRFCKEGQPSFCSKSCYSTSRRKRVTVSCALCGKSKEIQESKYRASKNKIFFCSRACKDKGQKLESGIPDILPDHYGTGRNTYRARCFSHHQHKCCVCGESLIVEVHHLDHDHDNININNLVPLCPTHHAYMHSPHKKVIEGKVLKYMSNF
jgi:hypothetical protein